MITRIGERGPKLVLIHGWAMQTALFESLIDHWQDSAQLLLVDLPGHGRSRDDMARLFPMDDVVAELKREVGEDAIWLGWSMGGLFALQCAADAAMKAKALIMLSSSPCFGAKPDWPYGIAPSALANMRASVATDAQQTVLDFLQLEVMGAARNNPAVTNVAALAFANGEPRPDALAQGISLLEQTDLRAAVSALGIPNLWIGGSRDRLVSPNSLKASAALNAHGTCEIIAGAGHAAFVSEPELLIRQLDSFGAAHDLGLV